MCRRRNKKTFKMFFFWLFLEARHYPFYFPELRRHKSAKSADCDMFAKRLSQFDGVLDCKTSPNRFKSNFCPKKCCSAKKSASVLTCIWVPAEGGCRVAASGLNPLCCRAPGGKSPGFCRDHVARGSSGLKPLYKAPSPPRASGSTSKPNTET